MVTEPSWDRAPWDPPTAASEVEHLLGALERQRATFRWKADGLDDAGLAVRIGASSTTLGGLLLHLAAVEVLYSTWRLDGSAPLGPWDPSAWDTPHGWAATFDVGGRGAAEVYGVHDDAVARSRAHLAAAVERGGLDQPVAMTDPDGRHASLRRLLLDLLGEPATPGTPTCCARPSTAGPVRTPRTTGATRPMTSVEPDEHRGPRPRRTSR